MEVYTSTDISLTPRGLIRVHNAYLLASSWKIVLGVLENLGESGMTDTNVRNYIKNQVPVRDAYLLVVDTIEMLSNLAQQELSVAVIGSSECTGTFNFDRVVTVASPRRTWWSFQWYQDE